MEEKEVELVDPFLLRELSSREEILRCVHIGLLCVQEDPVDRPSMSDIAVFLQESGSAILTEPRQPSFFMGRVISKDDFGADPSANGLTISELVPR